MKSQAIKEQFVELRAQGRSFASIATELGVAKSTLIEWSKELHIELNNMRQIHLESLREKYRMGAERRMELFAKQLESVEGELAKRDLTNVPTERLFDLLVKLGKELNAVDIPLNLDKKLTGLDLDLSQTISWQA